MLLLLVACGRLVSAQLDVDAAAHAAARAASLARSSAAALTHARSTATDTLSARTNWCHHPTIGVNTDGMRPGATVTVTVTCTVPLADLALLRLPGQRRVRATASSPIDTWRATAAAHHPAPGRRSQT